MCQAEVYKVIQKNKGKWLSTREIAEMIDLNLNTVSLNLSKLFKQDLINKEERPRNKRGGFLWRFAR